MKIKVNSLKKKEKILVIGSFSIFLFTMLYRLTYSALWGDEWIEYFYSQSSILKGDMYKNIVITFQPPLYNFIMHFWLLIRKSVLWFRLFNVFLGLFSGVFLYKSVRMFYSVVVSCTAIVSFATCYQWIYCTQECSEYALMVFCLFGAIYYFLNILDSFERKNFFFFLFFCIAAVYSQYGAIFVVVPLLILFGLHIVLEREKSKVIYVLTAYIICFIMFALPLYIFFLKIQMDHNEISNHITVLEKGMVKEFFTEFGLILGYLYNFEKAYNCILVFGLVLLICGIVCIFITNDIRKRYLLVVFLIGYTLHFLLVKLQIYAMGKPGNSGGFLCRYSYFYLAIITIYLTIVVMELLSKKYVKYVSYVILGILCFLCLYSSYALKDNWHKNLDDVYADIWLDNEGWKDDTYLLGVAIWGFPHYVSRNEKYIDGRSDKVYIWIDKENLPDRFWVWSSNWAEKEYEEIYEYAIAQGYGVMVYDETEGIGNLVFFDKEVK